MDNHPDIRVFTKLAWLAFMFFYMVPLSAQSPYFDQTFRKGNIRNVNDSLFLLLDGDSRPKAYFQDVFMPVCMDTVCKPVYMCLFWDLSGNYLEYRVDEKLPLTKLEHTPFLPEDYKRLHSILSNKHSLLEKYATETIFTLLKREPGSENSGVDASSGATPYEIKQETVEGALYTCHTLWHYCHGNVQAILREFTENRLLNEDLVHWMINSGEADLILYGMEHIAAYDQLQFQSDLLMAIRGNSPGLANQIISRLPADMIHNNEFARSFWDQYRNLHPSTQEWQLAKLSVNSSLPASVIDEMAMASLYTREAQFILFMKIFMSQECLTSTQDKQVSRMLIDRKSSLSKQALDSLNDFFEPYRY